MAVPEKYKGIFPAFYACYDDNGNISRERTARLAEFYLEKGVKGLYVCGSSGEALYHDVEERKASLEATMEAVGGKLTIIAHIAAASTRDSIKLAKHAESLGVDAIAAIPGIYYNLNDNMVGQYWKDILSATDHVGLIIYNIPQTTNYNLSINLLHEMRRFGRVIGIKNSSTEVLDILKFRVETDNDFIIFNGADEQYLAGRIMGASGGIGGTYGYMPELYLRLEQLISENKIEEATNLQYVITEIIEKVKGFPSMLAGAKGILRLRGYETGGVRPPFLPLNAGDTENIKAIYEMIMEKIKS